MRVGIEGAPESYLTTCPPLSGADRIPFLSQHPVDFKRSRSDDDNSVIPSAALLYSPSENTSPHFVHRDVMKTQSTKTLFTFAILSLGLASGCSFEPTPISFELDMSASDDMNLDKDAREDTDLDVPDMTSPGDMPAPEDMDTPDDMATPVDMGPEDMTGEDMPVDMPVMTGLGDSCQSDNDCISGRCEFFDGEGICITMCESSCPDDNFVCFDGLCTPKDFCSSTNVGPGCGQCEQCDDSATCVQVEDDFSCVCDQGYEGDGFTCTDVDECRSDADNNCSQNATCENTEGGFTCTCIPGYQGDGVRCDPVADPCSVCDANAACVEVNGQMSCRCAPGYAGNGFTCDDVDECQANQDNCSQNATCSNTVGSFDCDCKNGFEGDGVTCTDVDECSNGTAMCDPVATCTNTEGGFTCTCPAGSIGNGTNCSLYASCADIKANEPASQDGNYTIATPAGDLQVYCDMTSDGGVGYTMVRFDDTANLQSTQQPYKDRCAMYGMDIVTPRSQEHMDAIISWNSTPPNIVNVHPKTNMAQGISNWEGECSGQACSFYINGRDTVECRSLTGTGSLNNPGRWSGNTYGASCNDYITIAAGGAGSAYYGVDVDGAGPLAPRIVYCEQSLDGGGWTLGATSSDDGVGRWTWDNRSLFTTDTQGFGNLTNLNRDLKDPAVMHVIPFEDLMFWHSPSGIWAAYGGVGDNSTSIAGALAAAPAPFCETTGGFAMTAGTLAVSGALCSTDLFFHPGDFDGSQSRCTTYDGGLSFPRDSSTYGPAWSANMSGAGCPFDDPAQASFGPDFTNPNTETDAAGFGEALGVNTGSNDTGTNYIQMYVRGSVPLLPDGDNAADELLVLTSDSSGEAGALCPYGSWDDVGDAVVEQGWVICGIND